MFRLFVVPFSFLILLNTSFGAIVAFNGVDTFTTQGISESVDLDGVSTTFTNKQTVISKFRDGSNDYTPIMGFDRFEYDIRSNPNPTRVFYENGGTPLPGDARSHAASPLSSLEEMFSNALTINYGSDNTFQRTLDAARFWTDSFVEINNTAGLNDSGVVIVERGANDNNFRVRAITSLDASDDPQGFSNWFNIAGGTDPFGSGVGYNLPHALYDSDNTDGTGPFVNPVDLSRSQNIGAFMIPFADFGLNIGDNVFGYEIAINSNGSRNGLDLLPGASAVSLDVTGGSGITLTGDSALPASPTPEIPLANTIMAVCFGLIYVLRHEISKRRVAATTGVN